MDDEQMRQVFLNVAVNSCEAMDHNGRLDIVAARASDGSVHVSFADNGPGIDPQGMERLFEPFFTTKDGGTGLGLAIANKIVTAHGGAIEYRNGERGALFTVVLPAGAPAGAATEDEVVVAAAD
jgi:signal transduction histidine kinase